MTPRSDHRQPEVVVEEHLAGHPADVVGADRLDRLERLVEGQDAVVERLLATDPRREVAGVVHPQLETAGQVRLGLGQLVGRDLVVAQPGQLGEDGLERRLELVGVDAGVDAERADVRVLGDPRSDVVGQPELLADRQEEAAAHPLPQHAVEDAHGPRVRVVALERRDRQAEVGLRGIAVAEQVLRPGGQVG